jgi:UDP-N-acetylmuramoyl-tripeptide--D-alanyl-D-alanine ligase
VVAAARMLADLRGGRAYAVLGHMAELGPDSDRLHRECGASLAALDLAGLVTVGGEAAPLAEGHEASGGLTVRCDDPAAAAAWLDRHTGEDDRILLKGSRSAAMERVLDVLGDVHGWTEDAP